MDQATRRAELAALQARAAAVPVPPIVLGDWSSLVAEEYAAAVLRLGCALAALREAIRAAEGLIGG